MNKREKYRKRFAREEAEKMTSRICNIVKSQPSFNLSWCVRNEVKAWLHHAFRRGEQMAGQWRRQDAKKKARKS